MPKLTKTGHNRYLLPRTGAMQVDALLFLNDALRSQLAENSVELQQLCDAAALPGVFGPVVGMPDIHAGFGLPIGGIMATRAHGGVVSAGAVGMDINCGVRLLATKIPADTLDKPTLRALMQAIEERIPAGVGGKSRHHRLCREGLEDVLTHGARGLVSKGYGIRADLDRCEESGCLSGAQTTAVSAKALQRAAQLSTLGGGNHFLELGIVERIEDELAAKTFCLEKGMLTVLIHTGSRGFGHQICTDYTEIMFKAAKNYGIHLPGKGLAACPTDSPEGRNYLAAMACAVNFAFANRQLITFDIREAFQEVLGETDLAVVYDVAHNIAKFEEHFGEKLLVHRKGATRALPPGHGENPVCYVATGHPAIVPGSMNSPSYVLTGTEAAKESFCSVNHGAGRVMSRSAAKKHISREQFMSSVGDVLLNTRNYKQLLDEAPPAYKNINDVVDTLADIGLTKITARLQPLAVIKGQGDD
ncbi:RtcB family protein [Dethiobacter alkaliphilus]|uniref:RtcB family protein n=1 Tax=Dethiobacter alkaliphilus TaxID=427926 RepID=UPI00222756A0|nr:RtcB family protein [Dethiobacter alkaliphilus]MCW3489572.1 RtcB family protein [Dethiobacter alkaliphilus]